MRKALHTRLDRLEQQARPKIYGIRWDYIDYDPHDPNIVHVPATGEELTVTEFTRRYPGATLIHVTYDEHWRD